MAKTISIIFLVLCLTLTVLAMRGRNFQGNGCANGCNSNQGHGSSNNHQGGHGSTSNNGGGYGQNQDYQQQNSQGGGHNSGDHYENNGVGNNGNGNVGSHGNEITAIDLLARNF